MSNVSNEREVDLNLKTFVERLHRDRQRLEAVSDWHIRAYEEGGVELPYSVDSTWISVNVSEYVRDEETGKGQYVHDPEKSLDQLAKIAKYATSQKGVLVTKNYDDKDFELKVTIPSLDEEMTFELTYYVQRDAVCTKRVVGYEEVPEKVVPATKKEIVEWDCEPLSLLKIATHKK
jgi:hypothetical protein